MAAPRWLTAGLRLVAAHRARRARLRAGLALAPRERLLAAAAGPDGGYALAASDRALYHRASGGAWTRLGWEQITTVAWDAEEGRMVVTGLAGPIRARAAIPLRDRGALPEIALERVTHSKLGTWRVRLPGPSGGLLVEARRKPGTGEVLWLVAADGPRSLPPASLRAHASRIIARLSSDSGLPRETPVSLPWPPR